MKELWYPTPEHVAECNVLVLNILVAKKNDKPKLVSHQKLVETIARSRECGGNIYEKAAILLAGIVKGHPFDSGNRRTAFLVAKEFLIRNGCTTPIKDNPENAKILLGIREGFYTLEEIKVWLSNGNIKAFNR